jgi:ATP-binding cassette subfamily B (MDR/TAP) protein 1
MMDVFTLTGEAMTDRGDFFASMFIVMAAGCLVFYFIMGWAVNVVAQVCTLLFLANCVSHQADS